MATIAIYQNLLYEIKLNLAPEAIRLRHVTSIRSTATLYNILRSSLQDRLSNRATRRDA